MKKLAIFGKSIFLSFLFIAFSCSSSADDGGSNGGGGAGGGNNIDVQAQQIRTIMVQGSWRVIFYFDSTQELTNNFTNFAFNYNTQGSVGASDGIDTHNGTWLVSNNSNNDGVNFNLTFNSPPEYMEISEDWDVDGYTETRIELSISVSTGTKELIFEKI